MPTRRGTCQPRAGPGVRSLHTWCREPDQSPRARGGQPGARGKPRGPWPLFSAPYRGEHASKSPNANRGTHTKPYTTPNPN
eukprot:2416952-Prymnesium_polylepis.1